MSAPDPRSPGLTAVQDAYGCRAEEYIARFGAADAASAEDRAVITAWARTVIGPVLDAGCGPGHWSAFLTAMGLRVEGVDATAAFVEHARDAHPGIRFRVADLCALDVAAGSLGGVLAWFSLIHLDPAEVPGVLRDLVGALRPGGALLVGFFGGADLRPFDHAVLTAWAWPLARMRRRLEDAGLEVVAARERPQPGGRVLAEISAVRRG